MQALNGLGDNTKYFIELSHQDSEIQDRLTQGLQNYKHKHEYQHKAENWALHPKLQEVKKKIVAKKKLHTKKIQPGKG